MHKRLNDPPRLRPVFLDHPFARCVMAAGFACIRGCCPLSTASERCK
jgi:hypothetical protein